MFCGGKDYSQGCQCVDIPADSQQIVDQMFVTEQERFFGKGRQQEAFSSKNNNWGLQNCIWTNHKSSGTNQMERWDQSGIVWP